MSVDERNLCDDVLRSCSEDRARYVFAHPHLATLALHLELVPVVDERCPTAATDGRSVFFNPYWMRRRTPDARAFVLAHEVWHNALLHFERRGGRAHARWALAIDHEINALLRRAGQTMPDDAVYFPSWDGLPAEQVYDRLLRAADGQRGAHADVHLDDPSGALAGATSEDVFGPIAGRRDPRFGGRPSPDAPRIWRDLLVVHRARLRGLLPGGVEALVDAIARPSIPWQAVLRDFVTQAAGGRFRWTPPSRRHVHRGLYLPSRRADVLSLAVAIDTSASTEHAWPRFAGELDRMLRSFGSFELRLLECDAKVQRDERYDDTRPLPRRLSFRGGGGTDFTPVFAALADEPPTALVFLTDGFGGAPSGPPSYPVLWALTSEGRRPSDWGAVVRLDAPDAGDSLDAT